MQTFHSRGDTYQTVTDAPRMRLDLNFSANGKLDAVVLAGPELDFVRKLTDAHMEHYEKDFEGKSLEHDLFTAVGDSCTVLVFSTIVK